MAAVPAGPFPGLEISYTVAVWAELFCYGIYVSLLVSASPLLVKGTGRRARRTSALIYLWTTIVMFITASLHLGVSLYRFLRAYVLNIDPLGGDSYMFDLTRADAFLDSTFFCLMTWLGDALVIYRCYYVWNRMCCIIIIPTAMLIASIALNITILVWYSYGPEPPDIIPGDRFRILTLPQGVAAAIFPIGVCQNIITTGLIVFKIWKQHRVSAAHGIVDRSSALSLIRVVRIIIESAMIYTLENIVFMILHFVKSPAQFILQHIIVPSIGIVFVLISVRVHMARTNAVMGAGFNTFLRGDEESVIEFHTNRSVTPGVVSLAISVDNTETDHSNTKPFSSPSYNLQNLKSQTISS